MERFKSVVSRISIPDHIAIDALMNTLLVECEFREDLYRSPTSSLQDAIARSHNFIRMEEDTKAIMGKLGVAKQSAPKGPDNTRVEPRQHTPNDKNNRKNSLLYVVDEDNKPISTLVVDGKKWNTYHRETDSPSEPPREPSTAVVAQVDSTTGPSRPPPDLTKQCKYHGVKGHDTSECKMLYAQFLSALTAVNSRFPRNQKLKAVGVGTRRGRTNGNLRAKRVQPISDQRA